MEILGLIVDFLIVLLLGWTIFVATKLSRNLSIFNKSKKELGALIKEVSSSVDHAEKALESFKKSVNENGKGLADKISEAKMLSDELELIYQSSNRVADRLERLTDGANTSAKRGVSPAKDIAEDKDQKKTEAEAVKKTVAKPSAKDKSLDWIKNKVSKSGAKSGAVSEASMFSIRDPEFEQDLKEDAKVSETWDGPEDIESEAERALYKALKARSN